MPPELHSSWALWVQAPLVVLTVAVTVRPLWRSLRAVPWHPVTLVLAIAAPLLAAALFPQRAYHFSGHEGVYGELLLGQLPPPDEFSGTRTFPLPSGLAWLWGALAPGGAAQQGWLVLNRLALSAVLLGVAAVASALVERGSDRPPATAARAGALAAAALFPIATLFAWSGTAYFVVPALALGAVSLLLGASRLPLAALAWGALAASSRLETVPLLAAALLLCDRDAWRGALDGVAARLAASLIAAVAAIELGLVALQRAEMPVDMGGPQLSALLENLSCLPLGGAWFEPPVFVLLAIIVLGATGLISLRSRAVLALALGLALVQPVPLIDMGARHLLPAALLVAVLAGPALVLLLRGDGTQRAPGLAPPLDLVFAALLVTVVLWKSEADWSDMAHRYAAGDEAIPSSWRTAADAGLRGGPDELLSRDCFVAMPEGQRWWPDGSSTALVQTVHDAAEALRDGFCVQWAVDDEAAFTGDTRAERLDRAVRTLGLQPIGWLDPAPDGGNPWLLMGASLESLDGVGDP